MKKPVVLAAVLLVGCAVPFAQAHLFAPDQIYRITFPTLAAVPESSTIAIGVLLSLFVGLQFCRGRRI